MWKAAFCFIFLILWAQAAGAESVITVEINESGDALWTMEKRLPLTITEINEWEVFIKAGKNMSKYRDVAEFNSMLSQFLRTSKNFSNRPMEVEKLNISYDTVKTPSGGFGIIRYSFGWKNFSRTESGKLFIGDAFSEGMELSPDSMLVIKIPDGYDVKSSSPDFDRRDDNRLVWEGARYPSFSGGEPSIVLARTGYVFNWIIPAFIVLISGTALLLWRRKRTKTEVEAPKDKEAAPPAIREAVLAPLPEPLADDELSEEQTIERFLLRSGGQAYQSDIVKEIGLSKSKISMVLAKMKLDGKILKIRKGKENLIRLVKK